MTRLRIATPAALAALLLAASGCGGGGDDKDTKVNKPSPVRGSEIAGLSRSLGQPVYWAGSRGAARFDLTRQGPDRISVRYPPAPGAAGGVVVGTYKLKDPVAATRQGAKSSGANVEQLPGGAVAFATGATDVHFAYPGSDVQVEVFDPAGKALALARSGAVRPVVKSQGR